MDSANLVIWTATLDYAATGEGRTMLGWVGYASSMPAARKRFAAAFGEYFAAACTVEAGVVRNEVSNFLWSQEALSYFERLESRGALEATSQFHFNLS